MASRSASVNRLPVTIRTGISRNSGTCTQIGENVESRASVGQAHVQHGGDHRRRSQQLNGGVNRFRLDAGVPRSFEKTARRMPDERFIVEDEDGRKLGFRLRIRVHVAAYLK